MYGVFLSAILVAAAWQIPTNAQTASAAESKPPVVALMPKGSDAPAKTELSASSAIVTIHGLCRDAKSSDSSACTTTVTKQEFDNLVNNLTAIGGQFGPQDRRSIAEGYVTTLINYEAAKKAGVEHDPHFAEILRLARMRAMGDMYLARLAQQAKKVSSQEIESYYKNNVPSFEELMMHRIAIPSHNTANLKDKPYAEKARKLADEMHDRAAKGEDMDKLEKEALDALGVKDPPKTMMAPIRRGMYEGEQEKILFALKPGEVAKTIEQPATFIIFRLDSRHTLTLDEARNEITQILIKKHTEKQEEARKKGIKIDFNESFVGPAPPQGWMPGGQRPDGKPIARSVQAPKK